MIFHGCFGLTNWWWLFPISFILYFDLIDNCIILAWDAYLWFSNFWVIWFYHLLLGSLLVGPPFKDPSTLSEVGYFWPIWLVFFTRILFYDAYYVIPHPPMKFQANTLCFGWVLEVVTLWLPLVLHLVISHSKPLKFTWYQGYPIH